MQAKTSKLLRRTRDFHSSLLLARLVILFIASLLSGCRADFNAIRVYSTDSPDVLFEIALQRSIKGFAFTGSSVSDIAVDRLNSQAHLARLAMTSAHAALRAKAANRIDSSRILAAICLTEEDSNVYATAFEKLNNPLLCKIITGLKDKSNPDKQIAAIKQVHDAALLTIVALTNPDSSVTQEAVLKIKNKEWLKTVACYTADETLLTLIEKQISLKDIDTLRQRRGILVKSSRGSGYPATIVVTDSETFGSMPKGWERYNSNQSAKKFSVKLTPNQYFFTTRGSSDAKAIEAGTYEIVSQINYVARWSTTNLAKTMRTSYETRPLEYREYSQATFKPNTSYLLEVKFKSPVIHWNGLRACVKDRGSLNHMITEITPLSLAIKRSHTGNTDYALHFHEWDTLAEQIIRTTDPQD